MTCSFAGNDHQARSQHGGLDRHVGPEDDEHHDGGHAHGSRQKSFSGKHHPGGHSKSSDSLDLSGG